MCASDIHKYESTFKIASEEEVEECNFYPLSSKENIFGQFNERRMNTTMGIEEEIDFL